MPGVITHPDAVTAEWLTEVLRQSQCLPHGHVVRIATTVENSYTSTILRLVPTYSRDAPTSAPARLLLKIARLDADQPVVGRNQRRKEVEFHNKIVPAMPEPPVARCHQAVYCAETGAAHLLLDDLSATHTAGIPTQPPSMPAAERAMDAFSAFHAFWWDHPALGDIDPLPSVAAYVEDIRKAYTRFAGSPGDRLTPAQRRVYERTLTALPGLWQRVASARHLTLIHGDANFSNVLLPHDPQKDGALIIDWQLYGTSFAAEDLAHLIPLYWGRESRQQAERDLLPRYHQGLLRHSVRDYTWDACWRDYRLAVILRTLFMPMWFFVSGSPESWWRGCLTRAMQAFDDLHCMELVEGA